MKIVKGLIQEIFFVILLNAIIYTQPVEVPKTYCNPMNLSYRFMSDEIDAREAADPVVILFKNDYYLFASRSGGYWWSNDLRTWNFVIPTGLDILEDYAPGLVVMRDTLFYTGSNDGLWYKSADPKAGTWVFAGNSNTYGDPAPFLDDDGKLYMYYGLSNQAPTGVVELDPFNFTEIGNRVTIVNAQASSHGWERRGDDNLLDEVPWIEGSWIVKENNKYYLHYAAPGTEFKTYADGIYVSDSPKGPFTYADYSPFSFKPTGFVTGAGHGATFKDKDGNYWRIATMVISVKNIFERRLGLFPVSFDSNGQIFCNTTLTDYPQFLPGEKNDPAQNNLTGMMLLSYKKYATASSSLSNHNVNYAADEEIRTYWSAQTGNTDEWLMIDLGKECDIEAVQINFAEEGTTPELVRGRSNPVYQQYVLEISNDGSTWTTLIDKSNNILDIPHDYCELSQPAKARYVKLKNVFTPGNGKFAVRDLRIFGNSTKAVFTDVTDFVVNRNPSDRRDAVISWSPAADADGYIVRYGIAPDKLYNNYMVYDADSISIHSLNNNVEYYFSVQAFDSGTDSYLPTGQFKSFKSGDWNDADSWQRFNGSEWIYPAPGVPSISDELITILPGHVITITANVSLNQVLVDSGGTLIINPGISLTVIDGIGTDLLIQGTLDNKGVVVISPSSTLSIVNGGVYIHNQDGGAIPAAEWRFGSTCKITGIISNVPSNGNQNFKNIIWDCSNQSGNLSLNWNGNIIGGNISVINTGTGRWQMCTPSTGSSVIVTINGDVIQSGGAFTTNGTSNANTTVTVIQEGNINITGGNFSVSRGSQGGTGKAEWYIDGDFSISNAVTQNSNPSGGKFIFTGSQPHNLILGSGNTLTSLPIEVGSGAVLNLGAGELLGSGIFILNAGSTFICGHPDGINGNLKNTGTKTLSPEAGYSFNGTTAQVTGDLLPDVVENLTFDNSAGITLSKSVMVNGTVEIINTGFSSENNNLTYGSGSTLKYSGNIAMTTSDNEFPQVNGPDNIIINNSNTSGVTLHANREIPGNLFVTGRFRLGDNNFTTSSADIGGTNSYVVINGNGYLKIPNVGSEEKFFPVGSSAYSPVWVKNNGAADNIIVRVEYDNAQIPDGGRVRAKWILLEEIVGGGDYNLKLGWVALLEDAKFRANRHANAGIFYLALDTIEAGTGSYTTQLETTPYTVSRGGINLLGTFCVGKFGDISVNVTEPISLTNKFILHQNYPNPFNPSTQINYSVPRNGYVTIKVYNLLGEEVKTLVEGFKLQGNYIVTFDASGLSSGIYLYRMVSDNFIDTKKTILLR